MPVTVVREMLTCNSRNILFSTHERQGTGETADVLLDTRDEVQAMVQMCCETRGTRYRRDSRCVESAELRKVIFDCTTSALRDVIRDTVLHHF